MAVESRSCYNMGFTVNNEIEELNMAEGEQNTPAVDEVAELKARVTELEAVVHTLAQNNPNAGHGVVVTWLEKVGERVKAFVEKVV